MRAWAWIALALLAAGCASGASVDRTESQPSRLDSRTLASGAFDLPAAGAFGEPGFHEVLAAAHATSAALGPSAGLKLVVALRDAGRPRQACSRDHPLSGCATVDWSDDESRPKVPPGGVFENSLTVRLVSGTRTFFLRPSGALASAPEPFEPG